MHEWTSCGCIQVIPREGKAFGLGEFNYYQVLVWSAILWQFCFLGIIGAIHYTSALVTGIFLTVLIPVTEVFAIFFFHEEFNSGNGVSLALFLWGFVSYFYGELKVKKKKKKKQQQLAVSVLELPKGTT